jgi:hypothetical protein
MLSGAETSGVKEQFALQLRCFGYAQHDASRYVRVRVLGELLINRVDPLVVPRGIPFQWIQIRFHWG